MLTPSKTNSVRTPAYILKFVKDRWGDYFDPVPYNPDFDPKKDPDALKIKWGDVNYVNPPYNCPKKFLQKGCCLHHLNNTISIFLLKTEIIGSKYFSKVCKGAEIMFFDHRIIFDGYTKMAPFSSMLVVFDGKNPGKYTFISPRISSTRSRSRQQSRFL